MVKFVLHFLFLGAGVAYLARRSTLFYWKAVGALTVGLVVNGAYGVLQLLAARGGTNLDHVLLSPLTGGASSINVYGAIGGTAVYRPNALTTDPNHLAVMLCIPLLTLLPIYLRLERGHRLRVPLAVVLGFLFLVMLSTLSRSGLLGLIVGLLVLAIPYRRRLVSRALLVPLGAVAALSVVRCLGAEGYSGIRHQPTRLLRSAVHDIASGLSFPMARPRPLGPHSCLAQPPIICAARSSWPPATWASSSSRSTARNWPNGSSWMNQNRTRNWIC